MARSTSEPGEVVPEEETHDDDAMSEEQIQEETGIADEDLPIWARRESFVGDDLGIVYLFIYFSLH